MEYARAPAAAPQGIQHTPAEVYAPMPDWQPIKTAPKDGTWILGVNHRGKCAVILWSEQAHRGLNVPLGPGWIFPFTEGEVSPFWETPLVLGWMPLPERSKATLDKLRDDALA